MNPALQQACLAFINSRCKLPQGLTDPDEIARYLLSTGKISQDQYNQARGQYQQMSSNGSVPTPDSIMQMLTRR